MTFSLEVDPSLETESGTQVENFGEVYANLFQEEEFIALGINPSSPTGAKPGSGDKVMMLAARYASGLPLWHNSDCYDHSPAGEPIEV